MTILVTLACLRLLLAAYADTIIHDASLGPVQPANDTKHAHFEEMPSDAHRLWMAVSSMPFTVIFGVFTLLCAWSLTSLLCFHAVIISVAQTTNERVRGVYRYGGAVNDADKGCCRNWFTALCKDRRVSQLPFDFSQTVMCDHSNRPETVWQGETQAAPLGDRTESGASLGELGQ